MLNLEQKRPHMSINVKTPNTHSSSKKLAHFNPAQQYYDRIASASLKKPTPFLKSAWNVVDNTEIIQKSKQIFYRKPIMFESEKSDMDRSLS